MSTHMFIPSSPLLSDLLYSFCPILFSSCSHTHLLQSTRSTRWPGVQPTTRSPTASQSASRSQRMPPFPFPTYSAPGRGRHGHNTDSHGME